MIHEDGRMDVILTVRQQHVQQNMITPTTPCLVIGTYTISVMRLRLLMVKEWLTLLVAMYQLSLEQNYDNPPTNPRSPPSPV